jgi:uncharacterized membrane protein YjgN (DUF898 family)
MSKSNQKLFFHGNGRQLFALQIVNILLTVVTIGIYYPWARAAYMKYTLSETEFAGSRFAFLGTGFELFKGMILGILVIGFGYSMLYYLSTAHHPFIGSFIFFFYILLLIPFAIHSSMRYRTSRTTWRGIHFGYRGDLKELMNLSVKGTFLSIITFGIYGAWYAMELRNYVLGHTRLGSVTMRYEGKGGAFFVMNLLGYLFTILTLGIYAFWWMKDLFNYYVDNIVLEQDGRDVRLKSTVTGGAFFGLLIINFFIVILTLGLGAPWAVVRTLNFVFENVEFVGELDLDTIQQTEDNYKNATGEDLTGLLDIGMV